MINGRSGRRIKWFMHAADDEILVVVIVTKICQSGTGSRQLP
jgi:hypothetical protein